MPGAGSVGTKGAGQDTDPVVAVPEVAKPAYQTAMVEPTFHASGSQEPTVTRIADDPGNTATLTVLPGSGTYKMTWGGRARHVYSKQQPWNYDESLYILENRQSDSHNATFVGTPTKILLDGQTMRPKYRLGRAAEASLGEYRWYPSAANRNVLVNVNSAGTKLQWIDVLTDKIEREWPLTGLGLTDDRVTGLGGGEGNLSDDGRFVALYREVDRAGIKSNDVDVFVVDMHAYPRGIGPRLRVASTDDASINSDRVCTWASMSASGDYVVIHWRGEKTSVLRLDKSTLALSTVDFTAGSGFGSGVGGDAWASATFACTTNGTTTVMGAFGPTNSMRGMKVTGGLHAGVPTTVYVTASTATSLTISQTLDAGTPSLRIGDEADKGYIWRMGHADLATNPYDSDADVIIGQDQRRPPGRTWNGQDLSSVLMTKLSTGSVTSLTQSPNRGIPEASSHHISTRNKRNPGWCYVSYFEKTAASGSMYNEEIVAIQLLPDGAKSGQTMTRFAHHHSNESTVGGNPLSTYQAEPQVVPSWDGRRIIFASDWARECDSGCGNSSYTGGHPSGIYQDYMITVGNPVSLH